jgi:nicotinate-nucleotide adenylyltransferase
MSRIALIGGSFNPPHVAHGMMAYWLLSADQADQVWLIPCFEHPLGKELAPFEHRYQMCRILCQLFPQDTVVPSRVEQELGGNSRTLHTIQHLLEEMPEHRFSLVVGSDILQEKEAWYRFNDIERLVPLLVVGRSGYPAADEGPVLPDISSSMIRHKLQRGDSVTAFLPAGVLAYIREHGLYKET